MFRWICWRSAAPQGTLYGGAQFGAAARTATQNAKRKRALVLSIAGRLRALRVLIAGALSRRLVWCRVLEARYVTRPPRSSVSPPKTREAGTLLSPDVVCEFLSQHPPRGKARLGGKFPFPELSAALQPEHQPLIAEYVEKLRGLRTQIEVRGHCSRLPVDGTRFANHFELSFAWAQAVADTLVRCGVEPDRIVVVAAGPNEPIAVEAYTPAERLENDRVEVLQVNRRVEGFAPDTSPAGDSR
jgi:outer membrane protein OmpA-like peptidoglycan-associated protein